MLIVLTRHSAVSVVGSFTEVAVMHAMKRWCGLVCAVVALSGVLNDRVTAADQINTQSNYVQKKLNEAKLAELTDAIADYRDLQASEFYSKEGAMKLVHFLRQRSRLHSAMNERTLAIADVVEIVAILKHKRYRDEVWCQIATLWQVQLLREGGQWQKAVDLCDGLRKEFGDDTLANVYAVLLSLRTSPPKGVAVDDELIALYLEKLHTTMSVDWLER